MIAYAKEAIRAFETGDIIELGEGKIAIAVDSNAVLSVQPDGRYETRGRNAIGPWETATRSGGVAIYQPEGHTYLVPIVVLP